MTQPLALDSAPHGEAGSWRRGEELIDALAYVDSLAPAERAAVDKLIAEEVRLWQEVAQCLDILILVALSLTLPSPWCVTPTEGQAICSGC